MIFKVRTQIHTLFSSEIDIYADDDIIQYLQDEYYIHSGVFDSIVSGKTQVNYHGFSEIPDELAVAEPEFQLIGDMENMRNFKSELIDTYAGSFPHDSGYDSRSDSSMLVLTMWVISIVLTCFFTFYETVLMKKENFIRITMGESLFAIWVKYILIDLIYIVACFSVCSFITYQFYGVLFMFRYALLMLGILAVLNYISICKYVYISEK